MRIIACIIILVLAGCSTIDPAMYRAKAPRLQPFDYFQGSSKGWGIVQDRKGRLLRHFVVEIAGEIDQEGNLVLQEDFFWSDGERSSRTWTLQRVGEHQLIGTADDVVGQADGRLYGNALSWQYHLNLEVDDSIWKITFDDWMFKIDDEIVINRAKMSKFGFKVGDVTIVFRKIYK